jgi:hypothetical protein
LEQFSEVLCVIASSLTRLSLQGIVVHFEEQDELIDINLPALISLDIQLPDDIEGDGDGDYGGYISSLWGCLNTPALETLSLYYLSDEQLRGCMEGLKRQRDGGAKIGLKSLCLKTVDVDGDTCNLILASCPNIVEFSLIDTAAEFVMGFILGHTENNDSGPIWPFLRNLTVTTWNTELLRAVVLVRKAAGYPIAGICVDDRLPAKELDWFREQVESVSTQYFL